MNPFDQLQQRHAGLLAQEQAGEEIREAVKAYILEAREAGREVVDILERDQLRANLRHWSSFLFDREHRYPNTDLAPLTAPARRSLWVPSLLIGGLSLALGVAWLSSGIRVTESPAAPTPSQLPLLTTATVAPTPTVVVTAVVPSPTTEPDLTSTPDPGSLGVGAWIVSLAPGDDVEPEAVLSGTFVNLQPGWSIHVLLQPLSYGGGYAPEGASFAVDSRIPTGEWLLRVAFGPDDLLDQDEQYIVTLAIALSDQGRAALAAVSKTGIPPHPTDFIVLPHTAITVHRGAYRAINGSHLLYSRVGPPMALYLADPEGGGTQALLSNSVMKLYSPSVSPGGQRLAYVGEQDLGDGQEHWQILLSQSNGRDARAIQDSTTATFERPLWSSDERYVVFSSRVPDPELPVPNYQIVRYDLLTETGEVLKTGLRDSRFPSFTPDNAQVVFCAKGETTNTQDLFILDLASGSVTPLLVSPAEETQPVVSPDGRWVAYVAYADASATANRDIYLFNLLTHETSALTTNTALDWRPQWSPKSDLVFFESYRDAGAATIWVVPVTGGRSVQVVADYGSSWPWVGLLKAYLPLAQ